MMERRAPRIIPHVRPKAATLHPAPTFPKPYLLYSLAVTFAELFTGDPRAFGAGLELGPGDFGMADALAEAAIGAGDDVFFADQAGVLDQPLGHQFGIFDQVRRMARLHPA